MGTSKKTTHRTEKLPKTAQPKRRRIITRPRARTPAKSDEPPPIDPDMPHWLPTDFRWSELPLQVRRLIPRVLTPAYRQFVLDAPGELERTMGLTLVHIMWLELCGQVQMALTAGNPDSMLTILENPNELIDRHLQLVSAKCQTTELLMKLKMLNSMINQSQPSSPSENSLHLQLPSPPQQVAKHPRSANTLNIEVALPTDGTETGNPPIC